MATEEAEVNGLPNGDTNDDGDNAAEPTGERISEVEGLYEGPSWL